MSVYNYRKNLYENLIGELNKKLTDEQRKQKQRLLDDLLNYFDPYNSPTRCGMPPPTADGCIGPVETCSPHLVGY